jgi:hypothetical protein
MRVVGVGLRSRFGVYGNNQYQTGLFLKLFRSFAEPGAERGVPWLGTVQVRSFWYPGF